MASDDQVDSQEKERKLHKTQDLLYSAVLAGISIAVIGALVWPVGGSRRPSPRSHCKNNFKQICLAIQNYESVYHTLPPAFTVDSHGKPLHSWRTLILPFLDQQNVYSQIDLTKPWDDPANAGALNTRLETYHCPAAAYPSNFTTYFALVTPSSGMQPREGRSRAEITQDPSKVLLVFEAPVVKAVPWMSPVDGDEELFLKIDSKSKLAHPQGFIAGMLDSRVEFLSTEAPISERRELISGLHTEQKTPN